MEPPPPPPNDEAPSFCPCCGALIIGRLPVCPGCGELLTYESPSLSYAVPSSGFGCLRGLATTLMLGIALLLGGTSCCFALLALAAWQTQNDAALVLTMTSLVCFGLLIGYIVGVLRFFRKL